MTWDDLPDEGDEDDFVDDVLLTDDTRNAMWRTRALGGKRPADITPDLTRKQQFNIEIEEELLLKLRRRAFETGRSQTSIVEELLRQELG